MAPLVMKLVLTGESGVGKTSLLLAYTDGKFPVWPQTIGIDFKLVKTHVDGRPVKAQIWDPSGGERFYTIRPTFYRGGNGILLCFDVSNRSSFEKVEEVFIPEIRKVSQELPIILIGCKADLRDNSPSTCVPREEIEKKSKEWKVAAYFETSALYNTGLFDMMKQCIRIGIHHRIESLNHTQSKPCTKGRQKVTAPQPPIMPLEEPLPTIQIDPSTFADDWLAALKDQRDTDVLFVLGSGTEMRAHKIVLCAASTFFADVLCQAEQSPCRNYPGIANIRESSEDGGRSSLIIAVESDVEDQTFKYCLQFIYTGLPGIKEDEPPAEITKLISLSQLWQINLLESICLNMEKAETDFNPSISDLHNIEMGAKLRDGFLQTRKWADISFTVEGHEVRAHRIILCTRCRVFSAMLNEKFKDTLLGNSITIPNTTRETFLALLEYLYSDHAPIEEGDPVGVLVLANQFCQPRLVTLAEYYITKELEDITNEKCSENVDVDMVSIMEDSKDHNAKQLPNWCLHFIAKNYEFFKPRQELSKLTGDNLAFVEEHRWPPISYLQELARYEAESAQYEAQQKKCVMM